MRTPSGDSLWTHTWAAENRLTGMTLKGMTPAPAAKRIEFQYDWQGRRIAKRVYDATTGGNQLAASVYLYDGWNLIGVLDGSGNLRQTFVWGLDVSGTEQGAGGVGGLLWLTDGVGTAQERTAFCGYDASGNVIALVQATDPQLGARYEYGPFGEVIRMTGPLAAANPFRFSTKYTDDETGLLYYGYRYYQPATGRWLSRDPLGEAGGINLYAFCGNDPVNGVDADGRIVPVLAVAAVVGFYFGTEQYANAPGPDDRVRSGLTGDNVLGFSDVAVSLGKLAVMCCGKTIGEVFLAAAKTPANPQAAAQAQKALSEAVASAAKGSKPAVVIGAYDCVSGNVTAAASGTIPTQLAPEMQQLAAKLWELGRSTSLCANKLGKCAEFTAANNLALAGAMQKNIMFTSAIRPRTREIIQPCANCLSMFDNLKVNMGGSLANPPSRVFPVVAPVWPGGTNN